MNPYLFGAVVAVGAFLSMRLWQGADLTGAAIGSVVTGLAGWGVMTLLRRSLRRVPRR